MMNKFVSRHAIALCLIAGATPALAQEGDAPDSGGLQEIVVTAQKRSEYAMPPVSRIASTE